MSPSRRVNCEPAETVPKETRIYFAILDAGIAPRASGLSTMTTKGTRHLSRPPIQQTRQPSMRSPMHPYPDARFNAKYANIRGRNRVR
jgi:hypothetical protein